MNECVWVCVQTSEVEVQYQYILFLKAVISVCKSVTNKQTWFGACVYVITSVFTHVFFSRITQML